MKREDLLKSHNYWLAYIQNGLYGIIEDYRKKNNLKKKDLAEKLGVSKGYITQVLSGDFDHKVSKLVQLSLAFGKVPKISYLDLDQYIKDDAENKLQEDNRHLRPIENRLYLDSYFYCTVNKDLLSQIEKSFDNQKLIDVTVEEKSDYTEVNKKVLNT